MSHHQPSARDFAVAGGAVRATVAGDFGAEPALLLMHGWALDRRMWAPQIAEFAERHLVVAIDRRGFGESTAPPDLAAEIDDVRVILDTLGLLDCVLFGMSQSARVAIAFAQSHRERLRGLVVQGAPLDARAPPPGNDDILPMETYRALFAASNAAAARDLIREHPLMRSRNRAAQGCVDQMIDAYEGRDLAVAQSAAIETPLAALRAIDIPALVVVGAHDAVSRREAAGLIAGALPRCVLADVPDAGHLCNLCNPPAFNAHVRVILDRAIGPSP